MSNPVIIGRATLYLGDCRDILPTLPKVDAVVTDPPYGIGKDKGANTGGLDGSGRYVRRPKQYEGGWDSERPCATTFTTILNAGRSTIIWGGNYFADLLPQGRRWLFWDKQNNMPTFSDGEMAWTSLKGTSVKKFSHYNQCVDDDRAHPTQKPLRLMKWCLGFLPDAETILDPFMGSGTTGVAAVQMGRQFIGIEKDERYFAIACERIDKAQRQGDFFVEAA
jgi:site-specific DNA-methyltransferase (adenine-specific)/modification methylase